MSTAPRAESPKLTDLDLVVRTPRLVLRPISEDDADDLWPFVSDPDFPRLMMWSAHKSRADTVAFARWAAEALKNGTHLTWVIGATEHGGRARGCISLDGITWQLLAWRVDRAELGYWLAPPLHGQGLVSEAAQAAVRFGFETLGLHKMTVSCLEENEASRRVIEKLGFRFLARQVDDMWRHERWWSLLRYEMTAGEYAAARAAGAR
jgi:ribosomal-protein-alanine N-acetyltransferase